MIQLSGTATGRLLQVFSGNGTSGGSSVNSSRCSTGNSRFLNRIFSIYTSPLWLCTLSVASLALRGVSSPLSRQFSLGLTATAKAPPPQALQLHLPHPPLLLLGIPVSTNRSQSKTPQSVFHTPSPFRIPLTRGKDSFPPLTPTLSQLEINLSRHTLLPFTYTKVFVLPSEDATLQPTSRDLLYHCSTLHYSVISSHVILRLKQQLLLF